MAMVALPTPHYRCVTRGLVFGIALACMTGCGSGKYPVDGKIVWSDGTPAKELAGGVVVFESTQSPKAARSVIKEDGSFRLSTERPDDGAAPGPYRVLIIQPEPDDNIRPRPPLAMDVRFADFKTSGLTYTVEPKTNNATFKVDRHAKAKKRP